MVTGHQNVSHVLVEPSPKYTSIFVPANTSELRPGGSGVAVVLRNLSERDIALEPHTEIGAVTAVNIVPSMQVGNELNLDEKVKVPCMLAQVESADLPGRFQQSNRDPEDILQKLDLSGIDEWEPQIQQET